MARRATVLVLVGALLLTLFASMAGVQGAPSLSDIPNPKVMTRAAEIGKYGGVYVTAQITDPRTFNYIVAQETSSTAMLAPVFDGLVEQNYLTGEIEPALAESWTVSPDGRTWVFTLRQGVTWHDGRPVTADDVEFTYRAIFTQGVQTSFQDTLTFDGKPVAFRKLDARRVQFRTEKPIGLFLRVIGFPVLPRHKLADALSRGAAEFNRSWGVNTRPRDIIGTGPYVMQEYTPGQRVTYLRNTKYWKVDKRGQRLPYLTRYVRLIVPNLDALRLKFLAKETDTYAARPSEYADFKRQEQAGNFTIYDGPETFSSEFVVWNQNPKGVRDPKLSWFSDVRFRRALNHAIDRATIANQVYAGRATAAWGPVSNGNQLYWNPRLPQYAYDLNRAQQLLTEGGYTKGADGLLRDSKGNVVEFVLSTNAENNDRVAMGNILRQDWTKLGIRLTYAPEAFNTLVGKLVGTFNWESIIIGLTGGIEPGTGRNVWLSSGSLHMWWPNQEKAATAWETEVDRLFEQIAGEVDQAKRKELYFRWQQIVAEQVPLAYFTYPKTQPAVRNTLGNIKIGLQGVIGEVDTMFYKTVLR
ncbi:MAG TPA: ABC transporter substrate-binding protein [bacterium]|nr:ABC transporter substrate-binding protein [bacterium]